MAQRRRRRWNGRFVSFEGGEGAGKTTQVGRLARHLRSLGKEVVTTREPGGTPGGEAIRNLLVHGDTDRWTPLTEALLNFAARQEHLERLICPALEDGQWVLSDRFADSTMAYQGVAGGVGEAPIAKLQSLVVGKSMPDLTIVLDLPVEEGLARASGRGNDDNRFERKDVLFHKRLRQAFLDIAIAEPGRCVVLDARQSVDALAAAIWTTVEERLIRTRTKAKA